MNNIFNKPPNKWNAMDYAEFNMLTNVENKPRKRASGGSGCLTAVIAAIAIIMILLSFIL